jgi:DNA-binding response OmpR family regulator
MNTNKPRYILYIEDDSEMIELVSMILNRRGFLVKGAHSGSEGLANLRTFSPELILLDLMMPDMDGWEVYHKLKSDPQLNQIPVIIITAKAQPIDRVLGMHIAKVDDYISKPFHPQDLINSIEKIINTKSIS